jgi:tungstate transport system permease protein
MEIIILSIQVSTIAIIIGMLIGIPCGAFLGLYTFPGKRILVVLVFTFMGLPPVLIGVIVYMLLSKYGLLGYFELLFTPKAMIIAQSI